MAQKFSDEQKKLEEIKTQETIQELQVNIATNNNVIQSKKDRIRDIEKEIYSLKNHKSNSEKEQNELNRLKGVLEELQGELKELLENRVL